MKAPQGWTPLEVCTSSGGDGNSGALDYDEIVVLFGNNSRLKIWLSVFLLKSCREDA